MNDVSTRPTIKIRTPMKSRNWPKIAVKPNVKVPVAEANPKPKRLLNSKRNVVEATLRVKVSTVRVVWSLRRNRSLAGKLALIAIRQSTLF